MANKIETAGDVFNVFGKISDTSQNQGVSLSFLVSNKNGCHVKAVLVWDLSSVLKHVTIETVGNLICFEITYSSNKLTNGFEAFLGVMYAHVLPNDICCVS